MGVMSIIKTDKLLMRKDVKRTTSGRNIREVLLTVMFSFNMLLVPVVHYALITLLSGISIFSWSYVDKTVQPHHFLLLLPFLPFLLAILVQFALYQKYVKPVTPMEQWFAFLSIYIPSRVYLIKNKRLAFLYHISSSINSCGQILLSGLLLLIAIFCLSEEEDEYNGFFIFMLEVPSPLVCYLVLTMFVASLLQWYMVISPNLSVAHFNPDYELLEIRLATFPSYWAYGFCDLVLREKLRTWSTERILEMSASEWTFLEEEVESNNNKEYSLEDVFSKSMKTRKDITLRILTLEPVSKEQAEKQQLLTNLGHAMISSKMNFTPADFAKAGFFFSHPRLRELQVVHL